MLPPSWMKKTLIFYVALESLHSPHFLKDIWPPRQLTLVELLKSDWIEKVYFMTHVHIFMLSTPMHTFQRDAVNQEPLSC